MLRAVATCTSTEQFVAYSTTGYGNFYQYNTVCQILRSMATCTSTAVCLILGALPACTAQFVVCTRFSGKYCRVYTRFSGSLYRYCTVCQVLGAQAAYTAEYVLGALIAYTAEFVLGSLAAYTAQFVLGSLAAILHSLY